MKAQPLKIVDGGHVACSPAEATHLVLNMPGPIPHRLLPVMIGGTRRGTGNWTWNGDTERPTLKPSISTITTMRVYGEIKEVRCHTFVNDGKVQFLGDCTHELAGTTVDLLDIEDDWSE